MIVFCLIRQKQSLQITTLLLCKYKKDESFSIGFKLFLEKEFFFYFFHPVVRIVCIVCIFSCFEQISAVII